MKPTQITTSPAQEAADFLSYPVLPAIQLMRPSYSGITVKPRIKEMKSLLSLFYQPAMASVAGYQAKNPVNTYTHKIHKGP